MIISDARRILDLMAQIGSLEKDMREL